MEGLSAMTNLTKLEFGGPRSHDQQMKLDLFGPSRKEIWKQLAEETGGKLVEGGFLDRGKVQVAHRNWTITLDKQVVPAGKTVLVFTRMRAPYVNPDGFRFTIYRKGFFSDIGKLLGMHDVEVGFQPFDDEFMIKGNDETKLRLLFQDSRLRELITVHPEIQFSVKDDEGWFGPTFPEGVDELQFRVVGVIKDVDRLKLLYELFGETLDQLCRIGSAYQNSPDVTL